MNSTPDRWLSSRWGKVFVILLVVIGVAMVIWFGMRAFRSFRRLPPPPPHGQGISDVEQIRGFLSVPFIAMSFGMSPQELYDAIGVPADENDRRPLDEINRRYFKGQPGVVVERVKTAVRNRLAVLTLTPGAVPPAVVTPGVVTPIGPQPGGLPPKTTLPASSNPRP